MRCSVVQRDRRTSPDLLTRWQHAEGTSRAIEVDQQPERGVGGQSGDERPSRALPPRRAPHGAHEARAVHPERDDGARPHVAFVQRARPVAVARAQRGARVPRQVGGRRRAGVVGRDPDADGADPAAAAGQPQTDALAASQASRAERDRIAAAVGDARRDGRITRQQHPDAVVTVEARRIVMHAATPCDAPPVPTTSSSCLQRQRQATSNLHLRSSTIYTILFVLKYY